MSFGRVGANSDVVVRIPLDPVRRDTRCLRMPRWQTFDEHRSDNERRHAAISAELEDPNTPAAVKKASQQFIYSIQVSLTDGEKQLYETLLAVVTGGHFITRDKRLLKRGDAIADVLGVEVLTPEAFVAKVREAQARSEESERRNKEFEGDV